MRYGCMARTLPRAVSVTYPQQSVLVQVELNCSSGYGLSGTKQLGLLRTTGSKYNEIMLARPRTAPQTIIKLF